MKNSPETDFQIGIRTRLISVFDGSVSVVTDQDVSGLNDINERIYDNLIDNPTFPYIRFGEYRVESDDDECHDSSEHNVRIHVYSDHGGKPQAKVIAHLIKKALHEYPMDLIDNGLSNLYVRDTSYIIEPDGRRCQAVIQISADIEDLTI